MILKLIMLLLLSYTIRYAQLAVSTLVKHAWAGRELCIADVELVLGAPMCALIKKSTMYRLLLWLRANRRTDATFKLLGSQTHVELGRYYVI